MKKSGLNGIILATNIAALVIMLASIFILFHAIYRLVDPPVKSDKVTIQKVELAYRIDIDTTKIKELKDSTSLEYLRFVTRNNDKILESMNKVIQNQEKRVDEIIERNKIQSDFVTYASAIFALILSIAGFFGFKSINEIKKESIERSEMIASEEAKKSFREYQDNNEEFINTKIKNVSNMILIEEVAKITDDIDNIKIKITECCKNTDEVVDAVSVNELENVIPFNDDQV